MPLDEAAFWKHKIRQWEQEGWERAKDWHEKSKERGYLGSGRYPPEQPEWLLHDFKVESWLSHDGEGEYQLGDYTWDYDHDTITITVEWLSGERAGQCDNYYKVFYDEGGFASLLRDALAFGAGPQQ
jgi:hypothetical protein